MNLTPSHFSFIITDRLSLLGKFFLLSMTRFFSLLGSMVSRKAVNVGHLFSRTFQNHYSLVVGQTTSYRSHSDTDCQLDNYNNDNDKSITKLTVTVIATVTVTVT